MAFGYWQFNIWWSVTRMPPNIMNVKSFVHEYMCIYCKCLNGDEWWDNFNNSNNSIKYLQFFILLLFECKYHITLSIVWSLKSTEDIQNTLSTVSTEHWLLHHSVRLSLFANHQIHFSSSCSFVFFSFFSREKERIMCRTFYGIFFSPSAAIVVHHPVLHSFNHFSLFSHYYTILVLVRSFGFQSFLFSCLCAFITHISLNCRCYWAGLFIAPAPHQLYVHCFVWNKY